MNKKCLFPRKRSYEAPVVVEFKTDSLISAQMDSTGGGGGLPDIEEAPSGGDPVVFSDDNMKTVFD